MATTVDTLLVRIETDMKGVRQDLRKLEQRTKQSTDKMNKSFSGMGKVFKLAVAAVIVREVARATGALIKLASDAEEMQAKSSVVFGAFTDDIRLFANTLAKDVGRSALELEEMAATVQDTFVPMGFSRQEGAELSKVLTQLAVDVGSFNNKADAEVMRAFQSALVGNHETMRQFGVVITEATLKTELLAMGFQGASKDASNQQKVQARLNLIMKGTTDAQGDAARTADSFANRVKKLQGQLKDLGARLGTTLIPVASAVVAAFSQIIETIESVLLKLGIIAPTAAELVESRVKATRREIKSIEQAVENLKSDKILIDRANFHRFFKSQRIVNPITVTEKDENGRTIDNPEKSVNPSLQLAIGGEQFAANRKKFNIQLEKSNGELTKLGKQVVETNNVLLEQINTEELKIIALKQELALEQKVRIEKVATSKLMKEQNDLELAREEAAKSTHKGMLGRQLALKAFHRAEIAFGQELVDETIANIENKEETEKDNHNKTMAQLNLELEAIKQIQNAKLKNVELTKKERELATFKQLRQQSGIDSLPFLEFHGAKDRIIKDLKERAELIVSVEMLTEANAKHNDLVAKGVALTEENISAVQKIKNEQADLLKLKKALVISEELYQKLIDKTIIKLKELDPMHKIITDGLKQVADTISDTFADAFMKGKLSLDSLANLVKSTVAKMIAHVLKMQVLAPILSAFGMQSSTLQTLGFQASGGTMQPNRPYIVGERGAELFVPSGAGTLLNNMNTKNAMSGASTIVNQSINLSTGVAQTVHAEVLNLLPAIKEQTLIAVSDSKRRGGSFGKVMG